MARVLLCLRGNVALPGDLALSDRELRALAPRAALVRLPIVAAWSAFAAALPADAAVAGESALAGLLIAASGAGYVGRLDAVQVRLLLRRATFLQQLLVAPEPAEAAAFRALAAGQPPLRRWAPPLLLALTDQCATELASLAAAAARDAARVAPLFAAVCAALLGEPAGERQRAQAVALARRPRASAYLTHDIHVYKAKFFPRLARVALNLTLPPGAAAGPALDPFAGSGTALLEAARLGFPSLGADLDPLSVLIGRAKLLLPDLDPEALAVGALARPAAAPPHRGAPALTLPPWLARKFAPAEAAALVAQVAALNGQIAALPAGAVRTVARVCLSDALTRKLRMRFLGTGVGRFALELAKPGLGELFARRYAALAREALLYRTALRDCDLALAAPASLIAADARVLPLAAGSVAAIVTSPPYLPASSGRENYARSKAPSLLALGLLDAAGIEALDRVATGSMQAAGGATAAYAPTTADGLLPAEAALVAWLAADPLRAIKAEPCRRYFLDLHRALAEMARTLRPGGRAAIIVGTRSTFYRYATREPLYTVEAAALLAEAAAAAGLAVEERIEIELDKGNRNARPRSRDSYSETLALARKV